MYKRRIKYFLQKIVILGLFSLICVHFVGKIVGSLFDSLSTKTIVDCQKLIEGDNNEITRAEEMMKTNPKHFLERDLFYAKRDCKNFKRREEYSRFHVQDIEKKFPIAFGILSADDGVQTERLLRAVYRPHNFYCIHIDLSAAIYVHETILAIAECLNNVYIISEENVLYDQMNRLKADLRCMEEMLSISKTWKYFINLSSQNFPLKPNVDLVKILQIYNGANDIEGISIDMLNNSINWKFRHKYLTRDNTLNQNGFKNVTLFKGRSNGIFSIQFVEFVLRNKKAKQLLRYFESLENPAQYYWATLNHNRVFRAPGNFLGNLSEKPSVVMYGVRKGERQCHGKFEGEDCLFGVGDLSEVVFRKDLFVNKLSVHYQYLALDCIDQYLIDKTEDNLPFDSFYYKQLPFIRK